MADERPPAPQSLRAFLSGKPVRVLGPPVAAPPPPPKNFLDMLFDFGRGAMVGEELGPHPSLAALSGELLAAAPLGGLRSLTGLVKGATKGGFFSRVDDAVARLLPAKGAHPSKVAGILKSNATAEELAYRKVPEFLAGKGNASVTPGELQAHLAAHPAPVPAVKTRGEVPADLMAQRQAIDARTATMRAAAFDDPKDWVGVSATDRANAFWWTREAAKGDERALRKLQEIAVDPDHLETLLAHGRLRNEYEAINDQIAKVPTTKYQQYQLPGGEAYRETLLTLPSDAPAMEARIKELDNVISYGDEVDRATLNAVYAEREALQHNLRSGAGQFRGDHFDDPNILAHTRSNERTLPTGERGRFLEEVQSDWHQQGKSKGYARDTSAELAQLSSEWETAHRAMMATVDGPESNAARTRLMHIEDQMHALQDIASGVPEAPFKESWPDLALKQQLLETAQDPTIDWLGFTSGQTQAARYDLSKQVSRVRYDPDTHYLEAFDLHGDPVIQKDFVRPEQLPDFIGKEPAEKLLKQQRVTDPNAEAVDTAQYHTLEGLDLQVGGEGMRHFYDQVLPKRLEKLLKPFGGTVERGAVPVPHGEPTFNRNLEAWEHPGPTTEPIWFARLSPEMKERIQREGLPLLTLPLAAWVAQQTQARPPEARR